MRIGFITERFHPYVGGTESRYLYLSKELVASGHEITVITGSGDITNQVLSLKAFEIPSGVHIRRIYQYKKLKPKLKQRSLIDMVLFGRRISQFLSDQQEKYDILEINSLPMLYLKFIDPIILDKLILTWHEIWQDYWDRYGILGKIGKRIEQDLLNHGAAQVFVSEFTRSRSGRCNNGDIPQAVIPNGINMECLKKPKRRKEEPQILFVGRLVPEKNVYPFLIRLFYEFKNFYPSAELTIVGDGPLYTKIMRLAASRDDIKYHRNIPTADLHRIYQTADLFILPTIKEGSGIAALEAMAHACVVITLDSPFNAVVSEFISHGTNGYVSGKGEFLDFMVEGYDKRVEIGEKAKNSVKELTCNNITHKLVNFYKKLL